MNGYCAATFQSFEVTIYLWQFTYSLLFLAITAYDFVVFVKGDFATFPPGLLIATFSLRPELPRWRTFLDALPHSAYGYILSCKFTI